MRGKFLEARLEALEIEQYHGTDAVIQTNRAVYYLMEGMRHAMLKEKRPRYGFLVYNASVHFWNITRQLMRPGGLKYLVDALEEIVNALQSLEDKDCAWRGQLLMTLVHGYMEKDDLVKAGKCMNDAFQLLPGIRQQEMDGKELFINEMELLGVHLGIYKNAECQKANEVAKKEMNSTSRGKMQYRLQTIRSGATMDGASSSSEMDALCTALADSENVEYDLIAETGILALQLQHIELALKCEKIVYKTKASMTPVAKLQCDLLHCYLTARELALEENANQSKLSSRRRDALQLARRADALKSLERILVASKRYDGVDLLHRGCILAWNLALPLLQPHLRKHVHRILQTATDILQDMESPYITLRSQLHFEVSKCEIGADFLTKAMQHIKKALALDSGTINNPENPLQHNDTQENQLSEELNDALRPLDKYLRPLHAKLDLKLSLYKEPDSIEEKAMMLVEQASDAHDTNIKRSLLNRAAATLTEDPQISATSEAEEPTPVQKQRANLWNDIARQAWKIKDVGLTHKATDIVLKDAWREDKYREYVIMQTELYLVRGECFVHQLQLYDFDPIMARLSENADIATEIRIPGTTILIDGSDEDKLIVQPIMELKCKAIEAFLASLKLAQLLKANWLAENAVIHLWNYHLQCLGNTTLHKDVLPDLKRSLQVCLKTDILTNGKLLANVAHVLSQLLELNGELDAAEKLCTTYMTRCTVLQSKPLVACKARILQQKSKKVADVGSTKVEVNMLGNLEFIETLSFSAIERGNVLKSSIPEWSKYCESKAAEPAEEAQTLEEVDDQTEIFAEIWTRFAKAALELSSVTQIEHCCKTGLSSIPNSTEARNLIPNRVWRWYSICEATWGQGMAKLIVPGGKQDKIMQDTIRLDAISHFTIAASFATNGKHSQLALNAAKLMWNTAIEMMGSREDRHQLLPSVKHMLKELAGDTTDLPFRATLYCFLFEILADQEEWREGIRSVSEAFQQIPPHLQKPLWQFRVIYLCKLGQSVQDGLSKMKETDSVLQAKVWLTVARSSFSLSAQYNAYDKAIETVQGGHAKVDFLMEAGDWLLVSNMPREDVQSYFLAAIDTLLDFQESSQTGVLDMEDVDGSEVASRYSHQSSKKTVGSTRTAKKPKGPKSVLHSKGTRSVKSFAITSATSVGVDISESGEARKPDSSHYDRLLRCYMPLILTADTISDSETYLLLAVQAVQGLLHLLYESANITILSQDYDPTSETDFEAWVETQMLPLQVPEHASDWLDFNVMTSEPLVEALKNPNVEKRCYTISKSSLPAYPLTLQYLFLLVDSLSERCLEQFTFPCLALLKLISVLVLEDNEQIQVSSYIHLLSANIALKLGYRKAFHENWCLVGTLGISSEDVQHFSASMESTTEKLSTQNALIMARRQRNISSIEIRDIWTRKANVALELGEHLACKQLLAAAAPHNKAYHDVENQNACKQIEAKLLVAEGQALQGITILMQNVKHFSMSLKQWSNTMHMIVSLLRKCSKPKKGIEFCTVAIQKLQDMIKIHSIASVPCNNDEWTDLEVVECLTQTYYHQAQCYVDLCTTAKTMGRRWTTLWQQAEQSFNLALESIEQIGQTKMSAELLVAYAEALISMHSDPFMMPTNEHEHRQKAATLYRRAHDICEKLFMLSDIKQRNSLPMSAVLLSDIKIKLAKNNLLLHALRIEPYMRYYKTLEAEQNTIVDQWLKSTKSAHLGESNSPKMSYLSEAIMLFASAYDIQQKVQNGWRNCISQSLLAYANAIASDHDNTMHGEEAEKKYGIISSVCVYSDDTKAAGENLFSNQIVAYHHSLMEAIKLKSREAIMHSTLSLVEYTGCQNASISFSYLLWYQSCVVALELESLMKRASVESSRVKLVLEQQNELRARYTITSARQFLFAEAFLNDHTCIQQRLAVHTVVDSCVASLPPDEAVLCLQFSPDRLHLYVGALAEFSVSTETEIEGRNVVFSKMEFPRNKRQALIDVLQQASNFRASSTSVRQQEQDIGEASDFVDESDNLVRDSMEEEYAELLAATKSLLQPVLQAKNMASILSTCKSMLLLIDPILNELPIEACLLDWYPIVQDTDGVEQKMDMQMRRDFSIHMSHHRVSGMADTNNSIANNQMSFISDPLEEEKNIGKVMKKLHTSSIIDKWTGVSGDQYFPCSSVWQKLLTTRTNGGFMYYGPGRALSRLAPSALASMHLSGCHLVFLLDKFDNDVSYRAQCKSDNQKSNQEKAFEQCYETAALFTLAGANTVLLHQWYTSISASERFAIKFLQHLCKGTSLIDAKTKANQTDDKPLKSRIHHNMIIYGLPRMILK